MQEQGILAVAMHTALIGQPQVASQFGPHQFPGRVPTLRVQTANLTVPQQFNISSAVSDPGVVPPYSPTSPYMPPLSATYRSHSEQHSPTNYLAPMVANLSIPSAYSDISASPQSAGSPDIELLPSMGVEQFEPSQDDQRMSGEMVPPLPPILPRRNPGHTLARSFLPIVASMIPKEEQSQSKLDPFDPQYWEQCEWGLMQEEYLQLDDPETRALNSRSTGCKWMRVLHIPQRMKKRTLAGKWDLTDGGTERSIKTAPSVIASV